MDLFIVRICLLPLRNPLTIDNLRIYLTYDEAYTYISKFCTEKKISINKKPFDKNNRSYVYEDLLEEQFIWIEKHNLISKII